MSFRLLKNQLKSVCVGQKFQRQTQFTSGLNRKTGYSSLAKAQELYTPGSKLHGYTVLRQKQVPELELLAIHLKHDASGAEHLHISRDDKNNVFSIGFKTNPPDATGVPHILEHTTLCGSEKYQVRDPFFKMLNRSLANFMNAMTASDYTFYPFATTNKVDFANLRDVYLDATLHPLLRNLDFTQEGWRLEHADPRDPESPLAFKGVVYNEMKGQMSDSSYLYYIRFQESIYPSLNNSGGDPEKITDLTYEQLKRFHAQNYHPSNSKVFTYGNFPLEDHLRHLNENFSEFEPLEKSLDVKYPIDLSESKRVVMRGPFDPLADPNRQHKTSLTWFMGSTDDIYQSFCLKVVTSLLTDGHASPLYQALIESDLGSEYSPNTGLDNSSPINIFSIGLQGVSEENLNKVETIILDVIKTTYEKGFDLGRVEAILHQAELSRKHKVANFGMNVLYSVTPGWFNNVDPLKMLEWTAIVERFREDLKKPKFLESFLEKFIVDKPLFSFTMVPEDAYGGLLDISEQKRLEAKTSNLTYAERQSIYELGIKLLEKQEEKEDLSCLPTLEVKDIPKSLDSVELQYEKSKNDVPVQWRVAPTNGLTYFRALLSLEELPQDLHPYLPLFADALTNLGTNLHSMAELEEEIKRKTGGISASVHNTCSPDNIDAWTLNLALSGYSLDKDISQLLTLLSELLLDTNYHNHDKLRTLIRGIASGSANVIAESGHSYARSVAASALTPASKLSEVLRGVEQVKFINYLDSFDDESLPLISAKLAQIAKYVINTNNLRVALTCGTEAVEDNRVAISRFIDCLPAVPSAISKSDKLEYFEKVSLPRNMFYSMPFQVSYAGIGIRGVPYIHKDGAALQILANMLTHKHLHSEIREKGGAYGGGASYNGVSGIFGFYSYRDPNPSNTLQVVSKAGEWALLNQWSQRDLDDAKLSVFQGIDAPQSVESEGMIFFLEGISDELRQIRRSRLLDVSISDIQSVAERYLVGQKDKLSTSLLGPSKDWINKSNNWTIAEVGAFSNVDTIDFAEDGGAALA
ncbi:peptidase M16C associated-domain-containing protein [Dipodascopsis uninucleata]